MCLIEMYHIVSIIFLCHFGLYLQQIHFSFKSHHHIIVLLSSFYIIISSKVNVGLHSHESFVYTLWFKQYYFILKLSISARLFIRMTRKMRRIHVMWCHSNGPLSPLNSPHVYTWNEGQKQIYAVWSFIIRRFVHHRSVLDVLFLVNLRLRLKSAKKQRRTT